MKAYLLIFDESQITRKEMIKVIDKMPEVVNWHAFFGSTICLVSPIEAKALATRINRLMPDQRYLITEVEPDQKGGRMPRSVLDLLNSPRPADVEAA